MARMLAAIALVAAVTGCGGNAPPAVGPGAPGASGARNCVPSGGKPQNGSAFVVALDRSVDPRHAPVPRNAAEAVVFRLLYQTLTRVDCTGEVGPSLAVDWHASPDGLVWTFRLRRDVRLARADRDDLLLLDAAAVRDAWRESRRRLLRDGSLPWPWKRVLLRDVRVVDSERLEVATATPEPDLPALLSRPEFAVAVRSPGDGPLDWPRGTRGVIADGGGEAPARDLVWWPESKDDDASVARITFRVRPGADARDLTDADLLFVRDRDALAFFESRGRSRGDLEPGVSLIGARLLLLTRRADVAAAVTGPVRSDLA
ncbi:MAG TPA: hypothetical protein VKU85_21565, partial [bacterium]|nr:hypothetical protein [bacterium]